MLNGGSGNDVLDGGRGRRPPARRRRHRHGRLLRAARAAVAADPDGNADDGEAGENDIVETDVEGFLGGSGGTTC